jgi:hypothetical protein
VTSTRLDGPLLHVDLVSLKPETRRSGSQTILAAAKDLTAIDGVLTAGAIEALPGSDADLALFFVVESLGGLEAFGTDQRYTAFLQRTVAPLMAGLSGADVRLEEEFPPAIAENGVCLAVAAADTTYDWQVRSDLTSWSVSLTPAAMAIGLAVGERQRYRGIAMVFRDKLDSPMPPAPLGYGVLIAAGPVLALS